MTHRELLKLEKERSLAEAARCAAWREKTAGRPESRVVDRVLMEALWVALADRSVVPEDVAKALMVKVPRLARLGLRRLGYDAELSKGSMAGRMAYHAKTSLGSAVKPALRDLEAEGNVRVVRHRAARHVKIELTPPL